MVNHHFSPPFGNYFLFFPTTFSKLKKKNHGIAHLFIHDIIWNVELSTPWCFFFFVRIFSESHQGSSEGGLMNPMGLSFMGNAFSPNAREPKTTLHTDSFCKTKTTTTISQISLQRCAKNRHAYIFGNIFSQHKGSWIFK